MQVGTALCSIRSELKINNLFSTLFCRSYSTCIQTGRCDTFHTVKHIESKIILENRDAPACDPCQERAGEADCCLNPLQTADPEWVYNASGACPGTSKSLGSPIYTEGAMSHFFQCPGRREIQMRKKKRPHKIKNITVTVKRNYSKNKTIERNFLSAIFLYIYFSPKVHLVTFLCQKQ